MAQQFTLDLNLKAYPNTLTTDVADDYTVKVETQSTPLSLDDIAEATAERLGEEPTKVLSILQVAMEVMADAVASGFCVSTPFCYAQPMASGVVMESELSLPVDRERIRVYGSLRQGPALAEAFGKAKLQLFLQPAATGPYIAGMTSAFSQEVEQGGVLTRVPVDMEPGEMAVITGNGLKVVGTDPSVGVTLTKADDPDTSFFIPAAKISPNTPKKLQFSLPAGVTEGEWLVKVTTQYSGSQYQTKTPRTFELTRPITIGPATTTPGGTGGSDTGGEDDGDHQLG